LGWFRCDSSASLRLQTTSSVAMRFMGREVTRRRSPLRITVTEAVAMP
jgi:hypothetical protein